MALLCIIGAITVFDVSFCPFCIPTTVFTHLFSTRSKSEQENLILKFVAVISVCKHLGGIICTPGIYESLMLKP